MSAQAKGLIRAARAMSASLQAIDFSSVAAWVYDPLQYAAKAHEEYLSKFVAGPVRVLYMGMNPGPWGMAQTGVPFGEVAVVRDWLGIKNSAEQPSRVHPKRPIDGLNCKRSEVSGRRLWGLFRDRFERPEIFFADQFVTNYCPLAFMDDGARNLTPDKFPIPIRQRLEAVCDEHLKTVLAILQPKWFVGIGGFAEACAHRSLLDWDTKSGNNTKPNVLRILHPSPASPAANRDWAGTVTRTLEDSSVWGITNKPLP